MLSLVTGPQTEPLTVAEAKAHLRLDSTNGEPAPTAPTVALVVIAGSLTAGVHRWLWVARTADGQTEAGAVSAPLTTILATHGKATVTKPTGGSAVTYMDLYRTAAGGSTYLLVVADTANDGATYTDNIADTSLGAAAPSTNTTADPELVSWITAARQYAETFTHRSFITTIWDLKLDGFPAGDLWLPRAPLISITTATGLVVTYTDTAGAAQTWAEANYTVDAPAGPEAGPGRIFPDYGVCYPSTYGVPNCVTVRFTAGYGAAASVPAGIKAAMKLCVGHWWGNRTAVNIGNIVNTVPLAVDSLLWPYKVMGV